MPDFDSMAFGSCLIGYDVFVFFTLNMMHNYYFNVVSAPVYNPQSVQAQVTTPRNQTRGGGGGHTARPRDTDSNGAFWSVFGAFIAYTVIATAAYLAQNGFMDLNKIMQIIMAVFLIAIGAALIWTIFTAWNRSDKYSKSAGIMCASWSIASAVFYIMA